MLHKYTKQPYGTVPYFSPVGRRMKCVCSPPPKQKQKIIITYISGADLEVFVRQVEDHGLRADHLLAHQAGNVRHRVVAPRAAPTAPIRTATTTPIRTTTTTTAVRTAAAWAIRAPRPSDSCAAGGAHGGGIGEREAGVRPVAHYPVEMAEDDPVGDTVVRQ